MTKIEAYSSPATVSMDDAWFDIASGEHFWIQWRFRVLQKLLQRVPSLKSPILEIGCGHGVILQQMSKAGFNIDGCDLNENALKKIRNHSGRVLLYDIYERHPDLVGKYNTIMLMDVIEHIQDDVEFVRNSIAHLNLAHGHVIVNVPALKSLYSKYDSVVGHVRRYTRSSLCKTLNACGIEPIQVSYWGWPLLPVAIARKALIRFTPVESVIEQGFKEPGRMAGTLLRVLGKVEFSMPQLLPWGTSLMAIGEVRESAKRCS